MAVMMGVGAQRSIESGLPVAWHDLMDEYKAGLKLPAE
jgi:hypothetical protein